MAEDLKTKKKVSLEEAQKIVEDANALTQSFWRNPNHGTALKIKADLEVARLLRKALDDAIENETGGQYQRLRNLYRSYKTVEADVNRRAIVDARKTFAGLIDFSNIFTIGDLVSAITRLDPQAFARVMAMNAVRRFIKNLNDPNKMIEKMFTELAKSDLGESALSYAYQAANETMGRVIRGEGKPLMLGPATLKGMASRDGKPLLLGSGEVPTTRTVTTREGLKTSTEMSPIEFLGPGDAEGQLQARAAQAGLLPKGLKEDTFVKPFVKPDPIAALREQREALLLKNPPLSKQEMIRRMIDRARPQ
jgi:hypothetical protein